MTDIFNKQLYGLYNRFAYCCIYLATLAGSVVLIRKGVSKHHPYILEMKVRRH